jgi:hypothetical protein
VAVNLAVVEVVVLVAVEVVIASQMQEVANQVWLLWRVVDKQLWDKHSADRVAVELGQFVPAG